MSKLMNMWMPGYTRKNSHTSKKGFTLVELIVVLVILAVLAAIITPALIGWIDKAREKQDINLAKACLEATQAGFTEEYGKGTPIGGNKNVIGIKAAKVTGYGDVDAVGSDFAKKITEYTEQKPYIFLVATGNCNNSMVSKHDRYIVYYACYIKEKDSRPYYYYNGEWTSKNPTNLNIVIKDEKQKSNTLVMDGRKLPIQYYILFNADNRPYNSLADEAFWGYLRNKLPRMYD